MRMIASAALLIVPIAVGTLGVSAKASEPVFGTASLFSVSRPAGELPGARIESRQAPLRIHQLAREPATGLSSDSGEASSPNVPGRTPGFTLRFNGTGNPLACGSCTPPDTTGDVGPNHYVQMVNATKVAVYTKAGVRIGSPFNLSTLWPASAECGITDTGNPQVLYDELADRWVLAQTAGAGGLPEDARLCVAVSRTPDPLGQYNLYEFETQGAPNYFRLGVWPNGYYVGANESTYTSYVFQRAKMLNGNPFPGFVKFIGQSNFLMPADVDGTFAPGGGGLFYTFKDNQFHGGADRIELFQLTPDFATPANSTFIKIRTLNTLAPFIYTPCGAFTEQCINQPGTNNRIEAAGEWPMQRFAFRRVNGRQILVGNFTIGRTPNGPGGTGEVGAAIRWFELRKSDNGVWNLFQQGTLDPPDGHDRFMGSIAMDRRGDIALAYSVGSETRFPSIAYVTRRPGDPVGTMGAERVLQPGLGSQTGSARWGAYSMISVDPADDCEFWLTNEYYTETSEVDWSTKIGTFADPAC